MKTDVYVHPSLDVLTLLSHKGHLERNCACLIRWIKI
uniref:Uncharacterized protein n=1 Tax=Rhizophora mucronata TaxID=61149 RepID=A0A2P2Q0J6_RHIMU